MNRNTRTLLVVGAAVLLAALASYGVWTSIRSLPVREVPVAARNVVVAARAVPVGVMLTPDMVKVVGWPANAPVVGGFEKVDDVVGRGVIAGLVENEVVAEAKLAPKGSAGLPPMITPGMRAISVRVNDVTSVAGFAAQGNRVDVVVTVRQDNDSISRTVLSNIQVLAAGQNIDAQKGREGQPAVPPTVTLLLTPPDAERLALATTLGTITLVLRNPLDTDKTETAGVRMAGLIGAPAPPPRRTTVRGQTRVVPPPPPPPPPKPATIEVIRGADRKTEIIKK
jgi:pilus assembly protein CpaB